MKLLSKHKKIQMEKNMNTELKDIVKHIEEQLLYLNEIAADYHSVDYNKGYSDALENIKELIIGCYLSQAQ